MDISKTNSDDKEIVKIDEQPIIKVGNKNLSAVFLTLSKEEKKAGKDNIVSFTPKEAFVLKTFLRVKNYDETAKECGIEVSSVKRMLRRENIKRYLNELIGQAAIKSGTTKDWVMKNLRLVAEGIKSLDDDQKWAMKLITDIVAPKGPGVLVNHNQANFYSGLDKETLDAEWVDAETTAAE